MPHTLLVVDDSASILRSVTGLLEAFGYACITARSYEEARALVDAGSFCAMLCDIGILPTPDAAKPEPELGLALIEYARLRYPGCTDAGKHRLPILVLSALEIDQHREAMRRGADDFIKKPYTRARPGLRETIAFALRAAGHEDHADCAAAMRLARRDGAPKAPPPVDVTQAIRIGVTGRSTGNTADITLDGRAITLPNSLFTPLLTLIEARLRGVSWVARTELGAQDAAVGWKGASNIHRELRHPLGGRKLIANDRAGGYRLDDGVELDVLNVAPLVDGGGGVLAKRARSIAALVAAANKTT